MSVLYVATSDYPMEKVNRGNSPETGTLLVTALRSPPFSACKKDGKKDRENSPETGTRLATALRRPPFSVCKKGIEDVCSLHASYDGDCYRLFLIIVHCRAQLQK